MILTFATGRRPIISLYLVALVGSCLTLLPRLMLRQWRPMVCMIVLWLLSPVLGFALWRVLASTAQAGRLRGLRFIAWTFTCLLLGGGSSFGFAVWTDAAAAASVNALALFGIALGAATARDRVLGHGPTRTPGT